MMKIPTCALPSASLSGLRKVAALRFKPAVVQLAAVLHTIVVVIAPASLEYPMRLNAAVIRSTLNNVTELLNILIVLNDGRMFMPSGSKAYSHVPNRSLIHCAT